MMKKLTKLLAIFVLTIASVVLPVASSQAVEPASILAKQAGQTINQSIVISSSEVPLPLTSVDVMEGDTVLDVLKRSTASHGIEMQYIGEGPTVYVEGIDNVYEFDRGQGSGWMYSVNGIFPNRGAGVIKLVPGDVVEWRYTLDLGNDLQADLAPFRENLDPTLTISGVSHGSTVDNAILPLQIEAKSYFGTMLSATATVNGQQIPIDGTTVNAILQPGSNSISIKAIDQDGRSVEKQLEVNYQPLTSKPDPVPNPNPNPNPDSDKQPTNPPVQDYSNIVSQAIGKASANILANNVDSEWEAIALVRSGKEVPASYQSEFQAHLQDQVISKSGTGRMKITDVERLVMTAGVLGIDPTNADGKGFNLLEKIYNSEKRTTGEDSLTYQGNNGIIFALIALDSKNYEVPKNAKWTREKLLSELLKYQKADGSWSLTTDKEGSTSFDITAMALTAIAPYTDQQQVRQALDRAVQFLSKAQGPTGGFDESFVGGISSEATSQVIIGLTANQVDPKSPIFTKNGINLLDHLLSFQMSDGGFKHTKEDTKSNDMATEQALQALVAYDLFSKGKGSLYSFTDIPLLPTPEPTPEPEQTPAPISTQFTDVKGHWAADYIQQAVERGIVNGYKDGTFKPNRSLTRAQAVSILVRALELETDKKNPFTDMQNYAKETQAEIAAAYHHGLIKGNDGKFKPADKVTRAQMALMLYRAYEIQNGKKYTGQTKMPFTDMSNYNEEAKRAVTMLYDLKMATGEKNKFMPSNSTTRAQATKMLIEF